MKGIPADRRIMFALVGCGRISGKHIEALAEHRDEVELVAVCDTVEDLAKEAATKASGVAVYSSYEDMLEKGGFDVVTLCTPSGLHSTQGALAADNGYHVVSEKPIGIRLKDVDQFIRACDKNDVRLFVVKQNRLNTTLQLLKRAVAKGRFGRIYMSVVNVFWQRPQEYYDSAKWRGTWEFDGGAFMNQASHYIDALHWLVGEVDSVMAFTGTLARKIEAEDSGCAVLRFRNGAIGSVNVTMLTHPRNYEGSITIIGDKGTAKVGGVAVNQIEKWDFLDYDDDDKLVDSANYTPPSVYGFGHSGYYRNVIEVLRGRAEPDTDGRSGRKSLELILAIYKSAREGTRVALPLQ